MSFICRLYTSILLLMNMMEKFYTNQNLKEHVLNVTRRNAHSQQGLSRDIDNMKTNQLYQNKIYDCKITIMMKKRVIITKRIMMQMTKFLTKNESTNFLTKMKDTIMTKVTTKLKRVEILIMWESSKKSMQ